MHIGMLRDAHELIAVVIVNLNLIAQTPCPSFLPPVCLQSLARVAIALCTAVIKEVVAQSSSQGQGQGRKCHSIG